MQQIDLDGEWALRQAGSTETIPATVPGCVHTDLLAAGRIEDPFYRDNELHVQWVSEKAWIYMRQFDLPAEVLQRDRVLLRCEGLDTLATIRLNGRKLGSTDNMFRTWELDAKAALKPGKNSIEVRFDSVVPYILERDRRRRLPSWGAGRFAHGREWIRKEPCNFGWDWGPTLVTCGIWRPIRLLAFDTARIADVHIRQDHSRRGIVKLTVAVTAQAAAARRRARSARLTAAVTVSHGGEIVAEERAGLARGKATANLILRNPKLWWPNGMGDQPLYDVKVALLDADGNALDEQTRRIGLRTLRLIREKDKWGESFCFAANGVRFFAKGANWVPHDTFPTRLTRADYETILRSAAQANMNMIRAWGGGIYENDWFYEICDELGICVWQDFIFACGTYPTFDDEFMANVRREVEDNVLRIRHHPCLALWCGNNELEMGLVDCKLFDKMLPEMLRKLDPDRDYWPSSPHSPCGDRADHRNPACGDAHLWDVWHGRKPFEWYRTCTHRFNSEFGFQSFPEPKTVRTYTAPQDRNVTSFVMEHHQRSGIGNATILSYMLDWFRLPTDFDSILWLSQILQGMAMKYAVENWRRSMPRGMGTLYWQLNDCWPVASWSSVDSYGRWKALHYMARRFYAPLLISGVEDTGKGTVEVHVTSDLRRPQQGEVRWTLTDIHGAVLAEGARGLTVRPARSARVQTLRLGKYLAETGPRNMLLWLELLVGGRPVSDNLVTFARPKHIELPDPPIASEVTAVDDGAVRVRLTAERPALWAWLELTHSDARMSDNFIHLRPGRPAEVIVRPVAAGPQQQPGRLSVRQVKQQLVVRSLVDTYR